MDTAPDNMTVCMNNSSGQAKITELYHKAAKHSSCRTWVNPSLKGLDNQGSRDFEDVKTWISRTMRVSHEDFLATVNQPSLSSHHPSGSSEYSYIGPKSI